MPTSLSGNAFELFILRFTRPDRFGSVILGSYMTRSRAGGPLSRGSCYDASSYLMFTTYDVDTGANRDLSNLTALKSTDPLSAVLASAFWRSDAFRAASILNL